MHTSGVVLVALVVLLALAVIFVRRDGMDEPQTPLGLRGLLGKKDSEIKLALEESENMLLKKKAPVKHVPISPKTQELSSRLR